MADAVPKDIRDTLIGVSLAAGGANVIMQLSRLPVGHGVALSRVESGRVDRHPLKRLRTTAAYLVIALFGTDAERAALRAEIDGVHALVRSEPGDPVAYNAFDRELQLWVAACLYKGAEDVYAMYHGGRPDPITVDTVLYPWGKRLGTTLQVTEEMWPDDRAAFENYWRAGVAQIEMDDLTRAYLQGVAGFAFMAAPLGTLGKPIAWLLGPVGRFFTLGFLPQPFRDELRLPWSARRQRRFDAFMRAAMKMVRLLPRPLREFPLNVYLWDARRRIRAGKPIV